MKEESKVKNNEELENSFISKNNDKNKDEMKIGEKNLHKDSIKEKDKNKKLNKKNTKQNKKTENKKIKRNLVKQEEENSSNNNDASSSNINISSSESLHFVVNNKVPEITEIAMLSNQVPFITDLSRFLDKLKNYNNSYCIMSDDFIIGCSGAVNYSEVRSVLYKKTKKIINFILEECKINLESTGLFFCPRFANCSLEYVYESYSKTFLDCNFENYIFISKLYELDKDEFLECSNVFKEFKKDDLKYFPYRSEEVFLLNFKNRKNTEIENVHFRIFLLSKSEINEFMEYFKKEINQ